MKIAVATMKGGLEDNVSPFFGRCANYTMVECENKEFKEVTVLDNPAMSAAGGAGIQAAQYVADEGCSAAAAGNFGPNAAAVLKAANVEMIQAQGNVREVIEGYINGELKPVDSATVDLNYGKNAGFGRGLGGGRGGRWRR